MHNICGSLCLHIQLKDRRTGVIVLLKMLSSFVISKQFVITTASDLLVQQVMTLNGQMEWE